jgi:hypothetical protein
MKLGAYTACLHDKVLEALEWIDPRMAVNIEHEDQELD